ncbi:MAG: polyprenyl synthetase family protein [Deltaproteobacteria bacterium]|jgi:geranylgeranyl diphosphate synthase type II|nr:polyprenyl synthetase family protein [Deltaproteobacteria bacterium]
MFNLKAYITEKNNLINGTLEKILQNSEPGESLVEAMKYSLLAGGKRIRPVLCLAAAEAVDGKPQDALMAACAIEMVHTYSLIHDDLPAMDDDDLRRGRPTSHLAFDEATAILAGDALLTLAFEVLSSVALNDGVRAVKWLHIIRIIATAAGYQGMIQGQMRDVAAEGRRLSVDELESMHVLKTGALIEASLQCGAMLAGAANTQLELLKTYARSIGLAFQVTDDILNIEGNPEVMGKAVGTDMMHEKCTYPSILGLEASKQLAQKLVRQALQALETFDNKAEPLRAMANYILERKR